MKQPRLFSDAPKVKRKTILYAAENRECAERFLRDPQRYAGIQLEWAKLWWERNATA